MSPGKLVKRWEEKSKHTIINVIEDKLDKDLHLDEKDEKNLKGATEVDIVYSGLEEIICSAVEETVQTSMKLNCSFRLAAYVNAIEKIHTVYEGSGYTL